LLRQAREADQFDAAPHPDQEALFGLDEAGVTERPEPRTEIHRHLFDHPRLTTAELACALRMKEASVSRHLALMKDDGEAEQVAGRWNAT
jgi:DNA-binding transcriptional ArsR family regulator